MAIKKATPQSISIPAIDIQEVTFQIVGITPLIMHAWDAPTKREMLAGMMGEAKTKKRKAKDPVAEFINSLYWLEGRPEEETEEGFERAIESGKARFGFPTNGLKASAVSAGYRAKITKDKVSTYGAFHINGEFVEIKGIPQIREDMVRVSNGAPDIRYRGEFLEWEAEITVRYNTGAISAAQIINLFNLGGFAVGVGEWRPEKGGSFGMYKVR